MIKYSIWALLFWFGVAMLSATAEYAWIADAEKSAINGLWNGWGLVGTVIGGIGLGVAIFAGARGMRIMTLIAGAIVVVALRDMMTFNYPTIFYGPYEIVRWIILLIMIAIFVIPIMLALMSQSTSSG